MTHEARHTFRQPQKLERDRGVGQAHKTGRPSLCMSSGAQQRELPFVPRRTQEIRARKKASRSFPRAIKPILATFEACFPQDPQNTLYEMLNVSRSHSRTAKNRGSDKILLFTEQLVKEIVSWIGDDEHLALAARTWSARILQRPFDLQASLLAKCLNRALGDRGF